MQYRGRKLLGLLMAMLMIVSLLPAAALATEDDVVPVVMTDGVDTTTPVESEETGDDDTTPVEGEETGDDDTTPVEGEETGDDPTPVEGEDTGDDTTPVEGEETGDDTTPVEGEDTGDDAATTAVVDPTATASIALEGEATGEHTDACVAEVLHVESESTATAYYGSLSEALNAAHEGDTVKLLKDITVTESVKVTNSEALKGFTFDGNNKTITVAANKVCALSFGCNDGGNHYLTGGVTVKDLTIKTAEGFGGGKAIHFHGGGSVNMLNNVTVEGNYYTWQDDDSDYIVNYAVNFYGTSGGQLINCDLVGVFANACADHPVTLTNTHVDTLYVNAPDPMTTTYKDPRKVRLQDGDGVATSIDLLLLCDVSTVRVDEAVVAKAANVQCSEGKAAPVAKLNGVQYTTLAAAVKAAEEAESATITLLADVEDGGVVFETGKHKGLTIDFNGKSFTVGAPMVGSAGTETNGFQIKKDNNVTLKNGVMKGKTITEEGKKKCKHLIQNYSNLTLDNIELDGTGNSDMEYVLSNCYGNISITGSTSIKAPKGAVAFDVYDWTNTDAYKVPPVVTVNTTGIITGIIELNGGQGTKGGTLKIKNGTVVGTIDQKLATSTIEISGGSFDFRPEDGWCAEGYHVVRNDNGSYGVSNLGAAKIGETTYATLVEALAAAKDGDIITLLRNVLGTGIVIEKSITIDFGGKTFTIEPTQKNEATPAAIALDGASDDAAGILVGKGKSVVLRNGKVDTTDSTIKTIVTTNGDLTLNNLTLDGESGGNVDSTLSVVGGNTNIQGGSHIKARSGKNAISVTKTDDSSKPAVTVADPNGSVNGNVSNNGGQLTITNVNHVGAVSNTNGGNIQISGGKFSVPVDTGWCADGFRPAEPVNGRYGVTNAPLPTATPAPSAKPAQSPKTGDEADLALWLGLVSVSVLGLGWIVSRRKREQ